MILDYFFLKHGVEFKLNPLHRRRLVSKSTPLLGLSQVSLVSSLLFYGYKQLNTRYKMNEIVSKFLLARDNFMPEMHFRKSMVLGKLGFNQSASRPFTKNRE